MVDPRVQEDDLAHTPMEPDHLIATKPTGANVTASSTATNQSGAATGASSSPGGPAMSATTWLLLLTLSVIWGGSYFFIKVAVEDFQPLTVVLGRVLIAAVILHLVILARGQRMP